MGFAENLYKYRTARGLTQQQVADAVGVSRAAVTQWETGWSQPRMGKVEELARLFSVQVSALVDPQLDEPGIIDIRDLPEDKQRVIYAFVEFQRGSDDDQA